MTASISVSSAASPSCSPPPRRMDMHQDQHSCCSSSASVDQLLPSIFHRKGQPGTRVFQSCTQGNAAKQLLLQQLVLEVGKILDEEDGDDRHSDAAINNERTAMVKEETPCLPLRTRTDSIQRIRRNLNLKRSSWQQVALRGRTKEVRDHEATLHLLRDAAKRAAKRAMMDESTHSVASRTDSSIDGGSVRTSALLLQEARAAGRPPLSSAISSRRGSGAAASTTSSTGSEGGRGEAMEITRCISATKIQALARGRACRRRLKRRREQRRRLASVTKQQHKSYLPPPPTLSDYRRRALERQSSEITMSDFGDSTHYDPSSLISLSSHHTIISILEADDEENEDDDELDEFQLPRDDEQLPSSDGNWDETDSLHSFEGLNDLKYSSGGSNCYTDLGGTRSNIRPVSSPSPMNVPAAIGHTSFSSYFGTGMVLEDKPIRRPERFLSPEGRDIGKKKWCEDDEEVSLPEVPFGEDHDDLLDNDDDDLRPSFAMHRSEGSLDFFGDLHRRPTTFRRPRPPNEGEDNYFHHSMSGSSSSFSSRWDGSVAPLPCPSLPLPEQQRIASKAAISTYLPVRPPSRKLSDNVNTTNSKNNDSNRSMDIVFSTPIRAKASPKLPLRKYSTTPPVGGVVARNSPVASNNNSLVPLEVSVQDHVPCENMESSPKLPLRKVSMSTHGESTHTRSTTGEGGPASDIKPQLTYDKVEGRGGRGAPLVVADAPFGIPERKLSELPSSHHSSSTKNSICDTFRQTAMAKAPAFSSGKEPDPQGNDEEPTSPQRTERRCLSSPTSTDTSTSTPASIDDIVPGTTINSVPEGEEYASSPDSSPSFHSPRRFIASRSIGSWIQQRVQNLTRRSKMVDNRKGQKTTSTTNT